MRKFGVSYINQDLFLNEFTKGSAVHIDDLITLMKRCINANYLNGEAKGKSAIGLSLKDTIKKTDFFEKINRKVLKHTEKI